MNTNPLRPSSRGNLLDRTIQSFAFAALIAGNAASSAQVAQFFDYDATSGLTATGANTATWDAGATGAWQASTNPLTAAPVVWVNENKAVFQNAGGAAANNISVSGTVDVRGIGVYYNSTNGITLSNGTINLWNSPTGLAIERTLNAPLTFNTTNSIALQENVTFLNGVASNLLTINSTISGNYAIEFKGGGAEVNLGGANTFSGGVFLNGVSVKANTASALGTGIITFGTVGGVNNSTLTLAGYSLIPLSNPFSTAANQDYRFNPPGGGAQFISSSMNSVGGQFTKGGGGAIKLTGSNAYTGGTFVSNHGIELAGPNGALTGTTVVNIGSGNIQILTLNSGSIDPALNNNNRLNDAAVINLTGVSTKGTNSGGALYLTGNNSIYTSETVGIINFSADKGTITVEGQDNKLATLNAASLQRVASGTGFVRGTSLGQAPVTVGRITLNDISSLTMQGAGISATGATGSTKNLQIASWLLGANTTTGAPTSFVTYDTTSGLRTLDTTNEYASFASATTGDNVRATATTAIAGSPVINSLLIAAGATADFTGAAGQTLTMTSGALAQVDAAAASRPVTIGGFDSIQFGNGEAVITNYGANTSPNFSPLIFTSPIGVTSGGGLTKAGSGVLELRVANSYTGTTAVNGGTLFLNTPVGVNAIAGNVLIGAAFLTNGADNQIADTATITLNAAAAQWALNTKSETVANVDMQSAGTAVNTGLSTGNAGKLTVTGTLTHSAGEITLNSAGAGLQSTITAGTVINTGGSWTFGTTDGTQSLVVGSGGLTIGGGSNMAVNANAAAVNFISLGGSVTSQANAATNTISGAGMLRLNATARSFDVADGTATSDMTVSAIIANGTGTGGITKTGAGTLTLSGTNTYTGTTIINAGTFLIDGSTGAGATTVNSTGFIGGNGSSTSAVTLASGGGLAAKISNWNGTAGTGFDDLAVASLNAASVPMNLKINTAGLVNFSEVTKSFTILNTASGIMGFSPANVTFTAPGFTGTGTWSLAQSSNSLVLTYTVAASNSYTSWINGTFANTGILTGKKGPTDDPDGDGLSNVVENVLGADPTIFSAGLTQISSTGSVLKFRHDQSNTIASDVTKTYQWSTNLAEWKATNETNTGGTTATIAESIFINNPAPINDVIEVTVTVTGGPATKVFARLRIVQN